jgi:DNA-binding transcriptional ArsR family regulator
MKSEAESFKVLSVESRIRIVEMLKGGPLPVNKIAGALNISQSAVSQHLRVLKQAGLVTDKREGYHIYYSLNKNKLEGYRQGLIEVCNCGCDHNKKKRTLGAKEALLKFKRRLEDELRHVEEKIKALEQKQ